MVTTIRNLMSDSENWFQITNESDYHFPGVFATPHPKRLGYCADISTLPQYDCHNPHFLFSDIQLGKGKARNPQKVSMVVDGKEETLWYRIVPCGGVKLCPAAGCTHVVATREVRSCSHHPSEKLTRSNESSGECPVEFVYLWPTDEADSRRWITGITRGEPAISENLHNHPIHSSSKIPSKVDTDIRSAVIADPNLKTKDLLIGEYTCICIQPSTQDRDFIVYSITVYRDMIVNLNRTQGKE